MDADSTAHSTIDEFLQNSERRAYRMAYLATNNRQEALEIVQDAMFKLVDKYQHKPADQWGPLFTRVLQNRIKNWYRSQAGASRFFTWLGDDDESETEAEALDRYAGDPQRASSDAEFSAALETALMDLPLRQQQAFVLRAVQGWDTRQTAHAMACSQGSVKTHYSRALKNLQSRLENWR